MLETKHIDVTELVPVSIY